MIEPGRHPVWELTRTRIMEFWREKEGLFWTFGFPLLLAFVLGIAFRSKPQDIPRIGIIGPALAGQRIVERLSAQGWPCPLLDPELAELQLRRGRLDLLIVMDAEAAQGRARQIGVVRRQMNSAARNHPSHCGDRIIRCSGSPS